MFSDLESKDEEVQEKIMSPFGMAYMQLNETISSTGIDIKAVEPKFSYLQYVQPTKERPEYWNNLGYMDGFCRGNPGPCGAGACLFFPSQERIDLHQPVARRASILLGELVAIKMH